MHRIISLGLWTLLLTTGLRPARATDSPVVAYPDHSRLLIVRDAAGHERPVKTQTDWAERTRDELERMRALILQETDPDVEGQGDESQSEDGVPSAVLDLPASLETDPDPRTLALFGRYGSSLTASR